MKKKSIKSKIFSKIKKIRAILFDTDNLQITGKE